MVRTDSFGLVILSSLSTSRLLASPFSAPVKVDCEAWYLNRGHSHTGSALVVTLAMLVPEVIGLVELAGDAAAEDA